MHLPACAGGEQACPPKDVGGPAGFAAFLEAISNLKNEEHDDLLEWARGEYDPEEFNQMIIHSAVDQIVIDPHENFGVLVLERKPESRLSEFYFGETRFSPTLSMGIAPAPLHRKNDGQVVKAADEALYRAKGNGRNRVVGV